MGPNLSDAYVKNLVAKALVLRELRTGAIIGRDLIARVEAACRSTRIAVPEFDFSFWAGASLWSHLDQFFEWGFIVTETGEQGTTDWNASTLSLTEAGRTFLVSAEEAACELLERLTRLSTASAPLDENLRSDRSASTLDRCQR